MWNMLRQRCCCMNPKQGEHREWELSVGEIKKDKIKLLIPTFPF